MFKKYTEKNKNKLSPHEIDMMSKNIDYLWWNLNILDDEKSGSIGWKPSEALDNDLTWPIIGENDEF